MKTSLLAVGAALVATSSASAAVRSFNFDHVPAGSAASALNTPEISFHNGVFAPALDENGWDIPGSDFWQADLTTDAASPVSIGQPEAEGWGAAPSGWQALDGRFGPILLLFNRSYWLKTFQVTLDQSVFGDLGTSSILFLKGSTVLSSLDYDATVPGLTLTTSGLAGVTGIVLPGGAFYDDLKVGVKAVPETTSSLTLLVGCAALAAALRRRGQRSAS